MIVVIFCLRPYKTSTLMTLVQFIPILYYHNGRQCSSTKKDVVSSISALTDTIKSNFVDPGPDRSE
jgi:hypothetical protein